MINPEGIQSPEDGKNDTGRVNTDQDLLDDSSKANTKSEVPEMDEHGHTQTGDERVEEEKEALVKTELPIAKDIKGTMLVDTPETKASRNVAVSDASGSRTEQVFSSREPIEDKQSREGRHQKGSESQRHHSSTEASESNKNLEVVSTSSQDPDSGKHPQGKKQKGQQRDPPIVKVVCQPWDNTVITKCLIIGQKKVGKTSLIAILMGEEFMEVPRPRYVCEMEVLEFRVRDPSSNTCKNVVLDIIEIDADMRKEDLRVHFVGTSFVVLVTDANEVGSEVARPGTQKTLSEFIEYIEPDYKGIQIGIIENKNDEVIEKPVTAGTCDQSGRQRKWEYKCCMHTSCKTGAKKIRTDVKTWLQRNAVYGYLLSHRNEFTLGDGWVVED